MRAASPLLPPASDVPILSGYGGQFAKAFVALHPFFEVEGLDPATCEHGTMVLSANDKPENEDLLTWSDREGALRLAGKELSGSSVEAIAQRFGVGVRWSCLLDDAEFRDHRDIDRALRSSIGGLNKELADEIGAERLLSYCAGRKLFFPTEGRLQPAMQQPLTALLRRLDLRDVFIGDEFGDEAHHVSVERLSLPEHWGASDYLPLPYPRRIYSEDHSLLIAVHWDSFFTLIAGTERGLSAPLHGLEGFWCSPQTTVDWCLEEMIQIDRPSDASSR